MRFYDIDVEYFTKRMIDVEDTDKVIKELAVLILHNYDFAVYELRKEVLSMVQQAHTEVLGLTGDAKDSNSLLELINEDLKPLTIKIR